MSYKLTPQEISQAKKRARQDVATPNYDERIAEDQIAKIKQEQLERLEGLKEEIELELLKPKPYWPAKWYKERATQILSKIQQALYGRNKIK